MWPRLNAPSTPIPLQRKARREPESALGLNHQPDPHRGEACASYEAKEPRTAPGDGRPFAPGHQVTTVAKEGEEPVSDDEGSKNSLSRN